MYTYMSLCIQHLDIFFQFILLFQRYYKQRATNENSKNIPAYTKHKNYDKNDTGHDIQFVFKKCNKIKFSFVEMV